MIFYNSKIHDMAFKPKLCNHALERKGSARFLGIIINEQLNWNQHILGIKAKMIRYVGIFVKTKKYFTFLSTAKHIS